MRDLREDLRQRLEALHVERGKLHERLSYIDALEKHLRSIMEFEELRIRAEDEPQIPLFRPDEEVAGSDRSELAKFLSEALSDGNNWSLAELKRLASKHGMSFGDKNLGRVIHFALLGMTQSEAVEMVDKGIWRKKMSYAKS